MLLNTQDLAAQWNMAPVTITKWAREGRLPGAYKLGRDWKFDSVKVNRFFERSEQKPQVKSWSQSAKAADIIGFAFNGMGRKSEDRLEQLLGLKR